MSTDTPGILAKRLSMEHFHRLCGELMPWRTDPDIEEKQKTKGSGLPLAFVKGLRLSARLIYAIRGILPTSGLCVDWGHLLTPEGDSLSPECDIIVHDNGRVAEWNDGRHKSVMNFKFIDSSRARAVISCKSLARSVDKTYPKKLKGYIDNILLFAECCPPGRVAGLRKSAEKAGYLGFWHLYTYDEKTNYCLDDETIWIDFLKKLAGSVGVALPGYAATKGTAGSLPKRKQHATKKKSSARKKAKRIIGRAKPSRKKTCSAKRK